jgi:hypothetical protein
MNGVFLIVALFLTDTQDGVILRCCASYMQESSEFLSQVARCSFTSHNLVGPYRKEFAKGNPGTVDFCRREA